jgi:flagellar biosynthesis protein FlhG
VGKSMVTANISISLALMGYSVVAVDLDLGGANLHTCLGVPIPEMTISDYLFKKITDFNKLKTKTLLKNLHLISGAQDDVGITNLKQMHKSKLIKMLLELDTDYIILDLGAGTSPHTLDFFLTADKGILTTIPEPTAIENTYRFIKSYYYRKIKVIDDYLELAPIIDKGINTKISENTSPLDLLNKICEKNPIIGNRLKSEIENIRPQLIINQVRTQIDVDIGFSMEIICKKYFGITLDYLGFLEYDATAWQSIKKRKPLLTEYPSSCLVESFDKIVHKLLNLK